MVGKGWMYFPLLYEGHNVVTFIAISEGKEVSLGGNVLTMYRRCYL